MSSSFSIFIVIHKGMPCIRSFLSSKYIIKLMLASFFLIPALPWGCEMINNYLTACEYLITFPVWYPPASECGKSFISQSCDHFMNNRLTCDSVRSLWQCQKRHIGWNPTGRKGRLDQSNTITRSLKQLKW